MLKPSCHASLAAFEAAVMPTKSAMMIKTLAMIEALEVKEADTTDMKPMVAMMIMTAMAIT